MVSNTIRLGSSPGRSAKNNLMYTIMNKLKTLLNSWFSEPVLNAKSAYSISKYGKIISDDERYKEALKNIHSMIKFKAESGDMSLILELINNNHDYITDKDKIIEYFTGLSFFLKEVDILDNSYLFISWKKEHMSSIL